MSRDALVVGINTYDRLNPLNAPAADAEAIAQLLTEFGDFRVRRLPEAVKDGTVRVGQKTKVTLTDLEEALVQLFTPEGKNIPETALLYFSGHGLRKVKGRVQEGFLATSEVNPNLGLYGLSLQWLRRLLQESPVRQQIIWLDCCHSGELLNFEEGDPGDRGKGRDRSFIAASREFEVAYEEVSGNHGVLTTALLQGLDPTRKCAEGMITNYTLVDFINSSLRTATQKPIFANSGGQIILTGRQQEITQKIAGGICPYKGLSYFDCDGEDPKYFYGRTALTDQLLDKVREGNFLTVLGASGSGKSSVVRAGLLHQLKLGQRLCGSDEWPIYICRPGEHPLKSLAAVFIDRNLSAIDRASQLLKAEELIAAGPIGLQRLIAAINIDRVVLVADQLEEAFTLCWDEVERKQFFECILGALQLTENKLCLVVTMRADFFGKCAEQEYAGLAAKIQENLVTVTPMNREELREAIEEPAKQVGLEVERELVTQMIADVEGSPGSLPLLQYTLTELWKERSLDRLTLSTYTRLGGIRGTLQKRANEVYQSFSEREQQAVKRIFLELTQLGEGTQDTRRQVKKRDLFTLEESAELVEGVIQKLADANLVVTSTLIEKSQESGQVAVVDVAHEALIRHWPLLRQWVQENRDALRKKRNIETSAGEWLEKGKPGELAYLLQGPKLVEAENFIIEYYNSVSLSSLAQEFIEVSQTERNRLSREEEARRQRELKQEKAKARFAIAAAGFAIATIAAGGFAWQQLREQGFLKTEQQFLKKEQRFLKIIQDISLGEARPELLTILPDLLKEADRLKEAGNVDRSLAFYRNILLFSDKLKRKIDEKPEEFENRDEAKQKIEEIAKSSEYSLAETIQKYRISQLEAELSQAKFGNLVQNSLETDFEKQFTEGAIRTTYAILMREFGAKADLDSNGKIDNQEEANQMPCETLKAIEQLWRKYTENRCGWFGVLTPFDADDCRELDSMGQQKNNTLTYMIFPSYYTSVINRINSCQANTNFMYRD